MKELIAAAFSLLFLATAFGPAYAHKSSDYPLDFSGFASTMMYISPPPTTTIIALSNIRDLVAPETFVQKSGFWQWKYEGYSFEGLLPPIQMYWVEMAGLLKDETCYIPVFYTSGYPYVVIRLYRNQNLCGENKDKELKEYIVGKYIKAKIFSYTIIGAGDLQKNGYIEIMIMPE